MHAHDVLPTRSHWVADVELLELVGTNDDGARVLTPKLNLKLKHRLDPHQLILVRCTSVGLYSDFITNFEKHYTHFQRFHGGHRQPDE